MTKVTAYAALDMTQLNFSNLLYGDSYHYDSNIYQIDYASGWTDILQGNGVQYDPYGRPIAGTVTSFTEYSPYGKYMEISAFRLAAADIASAAGTQSLSDDMALVAKALSGMDTVQGSGGNDHLFAGAGNDYIDGRGGNDLIFSDFGADVMTGGAGKDVFLFSDVRHSTLAKSGQDEITDFSSIDRIDLTNIDANTKVRGDQAFTFIGTKGFSGKAGELRYEKQKADTYIYADVNGDKKADFALHLDGSIALQKGFFFL